MHPTIKGFNKAILHGLSWRDVKPLDFAVLLPFQYRVRGELCPIVTYRHARVTPHLSDLVQLAGDSDAWPRCVDNSGQAFPAEAVNHVQDAEPASAGQAVR